MKQTIIDVESYFIDKICNKIYSKSELKDINTCCNNYELYFLTKIALDLKEVYPKISDKDICISIIYTYYGLNLGEQTTDYITPTIYKDYADDNFDVFNLYILITTGDIMYKNTNLSSKIRSFIQTGEFI
jgi:hypothetical protein